MKKQLLALAVTAFVATGAFAQATDTRLRIFRQLAHLDLLRDATGELPVEARGGVYVVHERTDFRDPKGEIFVPTEEPFGLIEATLTR